MWLRVLDINLRRPLAYQTIVYVCCDLVLGTRLGSQLTVNSEIRGLGRESPVAPRFGRASEIEEIDAWATPTWLIELNQIMLNNNCRSYPDEMANVNIDGFVWTVCDADWN